MKLRVALLLLVGAAGCGAHVPTADLDSARRFDAFPVYWVGEDFEGWKLTHVARTPGFVSLIYGTCTAASDMGCSPPLELQLSPLCAHLSVVARAPVWRGRRVRGAPVGEIDSAPVLFARRTQVKVYTGERSTPGLAFRALRALRSLNGAAPVVAERERIPPARGDVLAGTAPCR